MSSVLYALARFHSRGVIMFHFLHLGNQVAGVYKLLWRAAAGENQLDRRRPAFEETQNFVKAYKLEQVCGYDFVEHDERVGSAVQHLSRAFERPARVAPVLLGVFVVGPAERRASVLFDGDKPVELLTASSSP